MRYYANVPLLFIDTWGWVAITNPKETHHQQVNKITNAMLESGTHFITTNFVLDETYTLAKSRIHLRATVELHQKIELLIANELLNVIHVTQEFENAAWRIFERYSDKDFSFTDCTSFAVMQMLEFTHVLTNDHHFEQMGFQILF